MKSLYESLMNSNPDQNNMDIKNMIAIGDDLTHKILEEIITIFIKDEHYKSSKLTSTGSEEAYNIKLTFDRQADHNELINMFKIFYDDISKYIKKKCNDTYGGSINRNSNAYNIIAIYDKHKYPNFEYAKDTPVPNPAGGIRYEKNYILLLHLYTPKQRGKQVELCKLLITTPISTMKCWKDLITDIKIATSKKSK